MDEKPKADLQQSSVHVGELKHLFVGERSQKLLKTLKFNTEITTKKFKKRRKFYFRLLSAVEGKKSLVLVLFGSFSPITLAHLRMLGKIQTKQMIIRDCKIRSRIAWV
jgi:hypothetical protein